MKKLITYAVLALLAVPGYGQTPPLSPEGRDALVNWHLCNPPEIAGSGLDFSAWGTRRFLGNTIKWRIKSGFQNMQFNWSAQQVMDNVAAKLGPTVAVVKVASTDESAQLTFRTGTSINTQFGQTLPVLGCATNPTFASSVPPFNIYSKAEVVCIQNAAGPIILTHEVMWHLFFTFCHTAVSDSCGGYGGNRYPPSSGNCVPGQIEASKWIYQVPPGTFPPN